MSTRASIKFTSKPAEVIVLVRQLIDACNHNAESFAHAIDYNTASLELLHDRITHLENTTVLMMGAVTSLTQALEAITCEQRGEGN